MRKAQHLPVGHVMRVPLRQHQRAMCTCLGEQRQRVVVKHQTAEKMAARAGGDEVRLDKSLHWRRVAQ